MSDLNNMIDSEVTRLTQELVRIPSENPIGTEQQMTEYVYNWLKPLNVELFVEEVKPGRSNVIARIEGSEDDGNLVYIAHMDTVPAGESWSMDPFSGQIEGNQLYGRGSADMKGGLAAAMVAFKRIALSGRKPKKTFLLIASVDEEGPQMMGAVHAVERGWVNEKSYVIATEPSGLTIMPSHKGVMWYEIVTQGKMSHAGNPQVGVDAIHAMAAILTQLKNDVANLPYKDELVGVPTVTASKISGGIKTNVVPPICKAEVDFRLVLPMTIQQAENMIGKAIDEGTKQVPGSSATYRTLTIDRPPVVADNDSPLIAALAVSITETMEEEPKYQGLPAYTDASIISARTNSPHCLTFGPGHLAQAHTVNEYTYVDQLVKSADILTRTAEKLLY